MKVEEAIKWLKEMRKDIPLPKSAKSQRAKNEAIDIAIEALEKQIPKKFKMVDNYTPVCPVCGEAVWDMDWCNSCGQKLDTEED